MSKDSTLVRFFLRFRCTGTLILMFVGWLAFAFSGPAQGMNTETVDRGGQKLTMGHMRSIAIAVEKYKIDKGEVPGPTEGNVPVSYLSPFVQPEYISELPLTDGWDQPILYWSNGKQYRVISNGRDGQPDGPYENVKPGTVINRLDGDIIFADKKFIQYPEGPQY